MKILWFTWKDLGHPNAGGAERINEEIAKRLARDGHEVILVVGRFPNSPPEVQRDGYRVIRVGNRYTVYWMAYRYYKAHLQGWADLVVDEMNTVPFFCKFYVRERNVLLAYQLCREIWFYQMWFPFSVIGYLLEPLYLRLLRDRCVITESESAKADLCRYGFVGSRISVITVGIDAPGIHEPRLTKRAAPTLLSLGSMRPMKRTLDQIDAFEIAKARIPELRLVVAGTATGNYGRRVLTRIRESRYAGHIEYVGAVDEASKFELMRACHLILVTSVKEGWGLIVTEANSQGTPAVVYDVDGLRDSVRRGVTGEIAAGNNPLALADAVAGLLVDNEKYARLRTNALKWSREFTFERSYESFLEGIRDLCDSR